MFSSSVFRHNYFFFPLVVIQNQKIAIMLMKPKMVAMDFFFFFCIAFCLCTSYHLNFLCEKLVPWYGDSYTNINKVKFLTVYINFEASIVIRVKLPTNHPVHYWDDCIHPLWSAMQTWLKPCALCMTAVGINVSGQLVLQ